MLIDDIDFARLYQEQLRQASRTEKSPQHWDSRAKDMAQSGGRADSGYLRELLAQIDLTGASTLLDVGCGPGTVCLAVADQLEQIYGLDYSAGMLDVAAQRAAARGVDNAVWLHDFIYDDAPTTEMTFEAALQTVSRVIGPLNANERQRLADYCVRRQAEPPTSGKKWALVSWDCQPEAAR